MTNKDDQLTDEQIRELNLKQVEDRLKETKSHDEKRRLEEYKDQKQKENVRVYSRDPEEEKKTSDEFLKEIREEHTIDPVSTPNPSGKPKIPNQNLRPRI